MDGRHVDHESVVIERDSGVGMGVVLGVILAIVLALAVMWFGFGAGMTGMMRGWGAGGSQSTPNNGPGINITVPRPDVNITLPQPDVNITVPNQQPVAPSKP